ncbi:hypothetical protein ACFOY4_09270 [Actinomadura syzygii]|uniref:Uncharacterized protein n=1 Tax=Actinomadura syzygii TaxID=1427538 RepID=A0A5D0UEI3_9ACTN|nr:hypothetical protein [Actinomadura syzygii]TYC15983.1 hypothetical protein FXF65_11660 [Actinomadura syzygii]
MTEPGTASPADLRRAQQREQLLRDELPRVRAAALAWRNGLGALLAGLLGFGLVKGRTDVGQLDERWAATVGVVLLLALIAGTSGALLLLRAAHGRPAVRALAKLPPGPIADRREAAATTRALRMGIAATLACTALLVGGVATTWYGPGRAKPVLKVIIQGEAVCGSVRETGGGKLVLQTDTGRRTVDLNGVTAMLPVDRCA